MAAAEFEKSTPYYEDDAWYDVSEWLDGNDYNPTDEVAGKWDDEKYSHNTASTDSDNDTKRTADDAEAKKQDSNDDSASEYGKSGRYADYGNANRDGNYEFVSIYYDFDHDGYCDALASYQDNNGDGTYDKVDYFAFNTTKPGDDDKGQANEQQQQSSKRHEVAGKIKSTKLVDVGNDSQRLVAQVSTDNNHMVAVDLGAADQFAGGANQKRQSNDKQDSATRTVKTGDQITASGPIVKIGDTQVVLAQSVKIGDQQEQQINRSGRMINGKVAKLKSAKVRGEEHQMALLTLDSGKQALVDLGATDTLKVKLAEGDQIGVNGVPVKVKDRLVILANSVTKNGEKSKIDRVALKDKVKSGK